MASGPFVACGQKGKTMVAKAEPAAALPAPPQRSDASANGELAIMAVEPSAGDVALMRRA
jgi:hypothetical protein